MISIKGSMLSSPRQLLHNLGGWTQEVALTSQHLHNGRCSVICTLVKMHATDTCSNTAVRVR